MRIAIVSDIHGNRIALEAVLADSGASPVEIVDRIRDLGWPGVIGNTDEMLAGPRSLTEFARKSPKLRPMFDVIAEMATATRELLGEERLTWLRALPHVQTHAPMALVHASPGNAWRAPTAEASDEELEKVYGALGQPVAVYAHIHRAYMRSVGRMIVVNTGGVSLSYDGDPRASYLLFDDCKPTIRRVAYDIASELTVLARCGLPHASWIARMLEKDNFEMP